ncbi:MAG: Fic family protein [Sphaerochaetaceae bacterium]|nr:Fic family protein [Sphaerochaetaceae bacterium]
MLEKPPVIKGLTEQALIFYSDPNNQALFDKINDGYLYWNKAKYLKPKGISDSDFWYSIKCSRIGPRISFGKHDFKFFITNQMQNLLHALDVELTKTNPDYVYTQSQIEEAIASSKMEGALTSYQDAKNMLEKKNKPTDYSQQMIFNNYTTIKYITDNVSEKLTPNFILDIHKKITKNTLKSAKYEGSFRTSNNVLVVDGTTGEIAHVPPSFEEIPEFINQICKFAETDKIFIHPIIKAIILHYMISYLHPFVDGNGRTARALFYWYLLKSGYSLSPFISISQVIYKTKAQYEKAFLYSQYDENDLSYFIDYNLKALYKAFENYKAQNLNTKIKTDNRESQIIAIFKTNPNQILTCKNLETTLGVTTKTIRADLEKLVKENVLEKVNLNKRLIGYRLT